MKESGSFVREKPTAATPLIIPSALIAIYLHVTARNGKRARASQPTSEYRISNNILNMKLKRPLIYYWTFYIAHVGIASRRPAPASIVDKNRDLTHNSAIFVINYSNSTQSKKS
jgi:hypothetical protein